MKFKKCKSAEFYSYRLFKIEEAHSQYMTLFNSEDYTDFAKNRWDVFIQIEKELQENYKKKTFSTKYGKLQFCEVRFQVNDLNAILKKIEELDELHFTGQKVKKDKRKKRKLIRYNFDWFTSGIEDALSKISPYPEKDGIIFTTHQLDYKGKQTGIEVIGNFSIDRYLARLETGSAELAEFAKEHFTSIFGQAITFKRIIMKNMEKILNEKSKSDKKKPVQEVDAHIQKTMMEELYLNILDTKVPALNNLTPREARKDVHTLPLLISWLKEIENMEEKKKRQGQIYFSIDKLKKELDIDF